MRAVMTCVMAYVIAVNGVVMSSVVGILVGTCGSMI